MYIQKINYWKISHKNSWVSFEKFKNNDAPAPKNRDIVDFSNIKLAPGKPSTATIWKDIKGRPVSKDPQTGEWVLDKKKSTAQRMEQARISGKWRGPVVKEKTNRASKRPEIKDPINPSKSKRQEQSTLSEKFIAESLKKNSNQELVKGYTDKLDDSWIESSLSSINAIKKYFSKVGIENVEYVGNKRIKDYPTADILITDKNGKKVGVSLKKSGNSVVNNTTLGTELGKSKNEKGRVFQEPINRYMDSLNEELIEVAKSKNKNISKKDLKNNKSLRKYIYQELGEQSLKDRVKLLHSEFKKEIKSRSLKNFSDKHILPRLKNVLNAIQQNKIIIASGDQIIDNKDSRINNATLEPTVLHKTNAQALIFLKTSKGERHAFGIINPRQEGVGYGSTFRADTSFSQSFLRPSKKMEKTNFTESDYLELIKLSRNPEYSDSMVYYRGKVLGRCPKGTTKSGKTCVPGDESGSKPMNKPQDLGGVSKEQASKIAKAKTTKDIVKARQEKNSQ